MINFTKKKYEQFINNEYSSDDYMGSVYIGAVCADLIFRDEGLLDADFYLLGQDDGYADIKGIPYSYVDGFSVTICDTYEETLAKLEKDVEEFIASNKDLANGAKETELTWEKVRVN